MKIAHIAIWTLRLEEMKEFYVGYFDGRCNEKYVNTSKGFESYFVSFDGEVTLEIMKRRDVTERNEGERLGIAHFAFQLADRDSVDKRTELLRRNGYTIAGEPRITGDGFYESVILDPDGNRVELVAH